MVRGRGYRARRHRVAVGAPVSLATPGEILALALATRREVAMILALDPGV
jgi:hypothetical protein